MISRGGISGFYAGLKLKAWAVSTRSNLLMWAIGPRLFAGRIARSVSLWQSTDDTTALNHAIEIMRACTDRWSIAQDEAITDRISLRVTMSGWAADVAGTRGDVQVVVAIDGQVLKARIKQVSRPDVSRHFNDRRFDNSGVTLEVALNSIQDLGRLSVSAHFTDGTVTPLAPTESVSEALENYGIDRWNTVLHSTDSLAVDAAAGHIDDLRFQLSYRGSWIETRRLGLTAMVFGVPVDYSSAVVSTAIRCGRTALAQHFLSICQSEGTLTPFEQATMLVALGSDAEAADLLRVRRGDGSRRVVSVVAPLERLEGAALTLKSTAFTEVLAASAVEASLPEVWSGRPRGTGVERVDVPPLGVHHVGQATLVRGSTVLVDGRIMLYEDAADPSRGFVAGNWDHIFGFEHRPEISIVRAGYGDVLELDEGVLLSGRCDSNYFHFLIEYLPRLGLVDRVRSLDGVPLIVTDELNDSSREALSAISGDRPIVTVSRNDMVKVRALHVPSMHTFIPDATRFPWIQGCRYSQILLLEMKDRLTERFTERGEFGRNVYLSRSSSARSLENGDQVLEVARSHGLECVDPGELTFAQQVGLFRNASLLLGVGGAAWANIIFAQRDSQALSMVAEQIQDFSMHSTMAELAGARMTLLLGKSSQRPSEFKYRRDYHHAPFSVNPRLVNAALTSALA